MSDSTPSTFRPRPVLGLWAPHPITAFVISQLRTARVMMASEVLEFPLTRALQAHGLLTLPLLDTLLAAGTAALSRAGLDDEDDEDDEIVLYDDDDAAAAADAPEAADPEAFAADDLIDDDDFDDGPPGTVYLPDSDATEVEDLLDPDDTEFVLPNGEVLPEPFDTTPVPAIEAGHRPLAWQWPLTLPDVLTIMTVTDFIARFHLSTSGDELRYAQVDLQHRVTGEAFDAEIHETLVYLARFQADWRTLFGHLPAYQQRLADLAALPAE